MERLDPIDNLEVRPPLGRLSAIPLGLAFGMALSACVDSQVDPKDPGETDVPMETDVNSDTSSPELGLPTPPTPDMSGMRFQLHPLPPGDWSALSGIGEAPDATATGMIFAVDLDGDDVIEIVAGNLQDEGGTYPIFHLNQGQLVPAGHLQDYFQSGVSPSFLPFKTVFLGASDINQDGRPDLITGSQLILNTESGLSEPISFPTPTDCPNILDMRSKSVGAWNLDSDPELELTVTPSMDEVLHCPSASALYVVDQNGQGEWTLSKDRFRDLVGQPGADGFIVDPYAIFMWRNQGETWLMNLGRTHSERPSDLITQHHRGIYRDVNGVFTVTAEDPLPANAKFREIFDNNQFLADMLRVSGLNPEEIMAMTSSELAILANELGLNENDYTHFDADLGFTYAHPMGVAVLGNRVVFATTSETVDVFDMQGPSFVDRTADVNMAKIREGGDGSIGNPGWGHTPWGTVPFLRADHDWIVMNQGWDTSNYQAWKYDLEPMGLQQPTIHVDSGYVRDSATGTYFPETELTKGRSEYVQVSGILPEDTPWTSGHGLCANDIDHDGDPDFLVGTDFMPDGGLPYVLENVGSDRWISVQLEVNDPDAQVSWTEENETGEAREWTVPISNYASPATICVPGVFIPASEGWTVTELRVLDREGHEKNRIQEVEPGSYSL